MKNQKTLSFWIIASFLMLFSISTRAQNPTYNCRITNATQVTCNEYEFDVVLARTGTTVLKLAMFQFGILIDPAIIPTGGVINVAPVPGSSNAITNTAQRPGPEKFSFDPVTHCIIVTAVSPPGSAAASTIATGAGTKLFRLRVGCSLPFNAGTNPNHTWSFDFTTGFQSKVFAYVGVINTDISVQASHTLLGTYNPVFTGSFADPLAQTVTSDMTDVCQLPGVGATISLASSQNGYTYYMYVNGTQITGASGIAFGTGSTISFGHLVASGVVTVKSVSCTGQIDMLNSVTITPVAPLNSAVTILANPGIIVTPGTSVTYTATPTNGGTTPSYQWYVNGSPDVVNGLTETYIYTPADGDQIYCEMTSSETCVTPATATSSTITMVVAYPPTAYAVTGTTSYCQGSGGVPVGLANSELGVTYTLYKNTVAQVPTVAGTGSAISFGNQLFGTYTVSGTNPGGTTVMTGTIIITETPTAAVSVSLGVDQNNLCSAVPVTFTATPTNGGNATYQWYLGTNPVGTNSPTYTYTPANGDQVHVVLTSDVACATGNPATSSNITIVILPTLAASVSVGASSNNVCAGTTVNFTATPTNGGTPTYQWYLGTTPVGTNSATYSYVPTNGDQVHVVMTSTYQCVTGNPATSTNVNMVVNPILPVSVIAGPNQNNICAGTSVTFTATPTNGGTPTYQWYLNGFPIGTNSPTYTYVPSNNDQVSVVMTSSNACVSGNPATSGSTAMVVNPCTGIESNLMDVTSLYVYPNPSSDRLYVNFNQLKETPNSMKLFNSLGQVCFESNMPLQTNQNGIDVSHLGTGSYTLQIVFENETVNKQVVIKK